MSKRDWQTYSNLFTNMVQFLQKPDLVIYLKAETDTLISRINNRNRNFEKEIDIEYLHSLNISYDKWITENKNCKILTVKTDNFNIFTDEDYLRDIYNKIESFLNE